MSWTFKNVAIVGSGAVGLYHGGRLAAAGEDVKFLLRSDFSAISEGGLKVESSLGDFQLPQIQAFQTAEEIGPVDLVIVSWKSTANSQLASVLPPLLHAGTQVLTLQNGLGNCEALAEIVGPERVMGGLCFICINRISPGLVRHTSGGRMTLGEMLPDGLGRVAELERRFKAAQIPAVAVADLEKSQWEKLVWNIPFNGLSIAEGGVTTDVLLASPAKEVELRRLMAEVIAAANHLGHGLSQELIDLHIDRTRAMGAYRTSSMIDFIEGREVEISPIWRVPMYRAAAAGFVMQHLAGLLQRIEDRLLRL
jgi:2-dehydropantoate 2-reductase